MRTVLLLALALSPAALAGDVTYGFDAVGAPGAFSQIAPGFANGPHLEYGEVTLDGGVILIDALFGSNATSGDNILATCDTCGLGDNPPTGLPGRIDGVFVHTVEAVSLDVINGSSGSSGSFTLTAFDAGGGVVDSDTVVAGPMNSPTDTQPLAVSGAGMRSFAVTTSLGGGYTFAIDTLNITVSEGVWEDLGFALAGAYGDPILTGTGTLIDGDPIQIRLVNGLEFTTATLVVGFTQVNISPFYGGTLVPGFAAPDGFFVPLFTNANGGIAINNTWPAGVPSGFTLYIQYWIEDPAAPFGLSASNAIAGTTP